VRVSDFVKNHLLRFEKVASFLRVVLGEFTLIVVCCCCCCYVVYGFGLVTIQPGLFLELKLISSFGKSICTIHAGPGRSAGFVTVGV
jgi:hypothetical protein